MNIINDLNTVCNEKMNADNADLGERNTNTATAAANVLQANTGNENSMCEVGEETLNLGEMINGRESTKLLGIDRRKLHAARAKSELIADRSEQRGKSTVFFYRLKNLLDFAEKNGVAIAAEKLEKYRTVGDSPANDSQAADSTEHDRNIANLPENALQANTDNQTGMCEVGGNDTPADNECDNAPAADLGEHDRNIECDTVNALQEPTGAQTGTQIDDKPARAERTNDTPAAANADLPERDKIPVQATAHALQEPTGAGNSMCEVGGSNNIGEGDNLVESTAANATPEQRYQMLLEYLRKRFAGITGEYYTNFCSKPRGGKFGVREWFKVTDNTELERIAKAIIKTNDNRSACIWIGNNLVEKPLAKGKRGAESDIAFVNVIGIDIDSAAGLHEKSAVMPETIADCLKLMPQSIMPTFVNATGGGIQVFYMVNERVSTTEERKFAHEVGDKLKAIAQVYEKRHGYVSAVDGTADLPRVMRLPGTYNHKATPRLCYTLQAHDCTYSLETLNAAAERELTGLADNAADNADLGERNTNIAAGVKNAAEGNHGVQNGTYEVGEDCSEYDFYRAARMVEYLPIRDFRVYDSWLEVGMCLYSVSSSDKMKKIWRDWSANDKLKYCGESEIDKKWESFSGERNTRKTIATLHKIARDYGYDEQATRQDFYDTRGDENSLGSCIENCPSEVANLKVPFGYECDWRGVQEVRIIGKREPQEKLIPIAPLAFISKVFKVDCGAAEKYEITFKSGTAWKKEVIAGSDLVNAQKLSAAIGRRGFLPYKINAFAEYLARFKSANEKRINTEEIFTSTGWRLIPNEGGGEHWRFIFPNLHGARVESDDEGIDISAALSSHGSAEEWKKVFFNLTQYAAGDFAHQSLCGAKRRIFIGAALSAPLIRIIGGVNMSAHIYGRHGSGKSTLLRFCSSIFGNPEKLYNSWHSTPAFRNNVSKSFTDLPTVMDDLESARRFTDFAAETYNYSLGKSDEKARRNGNSYGDKRFYGVRLSTGERELVESSDKSGAHSRALQIPVPKDFLSPERCALVGDCISENYGVFAADWLKHIEKNAAEIKAKAKKLKTAFEQEYENFDERHKQFLCLAGIAFYEFTANVLKCSDTYVQVNALQDLLTLAKDLPTANEIDDCRAGLELLAGWLAAHTKNIATVDVFGNSSKEPSGRYSDTSVYFFAKEKIYGFVSTPFKAIIENDCGMPSKTKFLNDLKESGILQLQSAGRNFVQRRIDDMRPCLYLIPESAFDFSSDEKPIEDDWLGEDENADNRNHDKVGEDISKMDTPF